GIVVDGRHRVVFTDVASNAVFRIEPDGKLTRLATGLHSHPLWRQGDSLYGEHVYWFEGQSRFERRTWRIGSGDRLEPDVNLPPGVECAYDSGGRCYRSDGSHLLMPDGRRDPLAGMPREPATVHGIALGPDDTLYIADRQYGCVWQAPASGNPRRIYESPRLWTPWGVAVDGTTVYVLEDRPAGWATVFRFWEGPRVVRLREGRADVVMSIDFGRGNLVFVLLAAVAVMLLFVRVREARRRARL
ncbi:MAG: hypothetical protein ACRD96_12555, partial [Bryobacteraceae bacterium]